MSIPWFEDEHRAVADAVLKPVLIPHPDGDGASVEGIALEVWNEVLNQLKRWGVQDHPNGTGPDVTWAWANGVSADRIVGRFTGVELAEHAKVDCEAAARAGTLDWTYILLEEVFEAFAEDDPAKLRAELIQVAAVAASWIENIDRQEAARD